MTKIKKSQTRKAFNKNKKAIKKGIGTDLRIVFLYNL